MDTYEITVGGSKYSISSDGPLTPEQLKAAASKIIGTKAPKAKKPWWKPSTDASGGVVAGAAAGLAPRVRPMDDYEDDRAEVARRADFKKSEVGKGRAIAELRKMADNAGEGVDNLRYNVLSKLGIPTSPPSKDSFVSRTATAAANIPVDAVEDPLGTLAQAALAQVGGTAIGAGLKGLGKLAKGLGKAAQVAEEVAPQVEKAASMPKAPRIPVKARPSEGMKSLERELWAKELKEGRPVPPDILKKYPDLKPTKLKVVTGGKYGKLKDELADIIRTGKKAGPPPEEPVTLGPQGQRITTADTLASDLERSLQGEVPKTAGKDPWDLLYEQEAKVANLKGQSRLTRGAVNIKPPKMPKTAKEAQQLAGKNVGDLYKGLSGVSRTMQTIGDLSATFRQGGYLMGKGGSVDAIKKSLKSIVDTDVMAAVEKQAVSGPNASTYKRAKLFLSVKGEEEPFLESFAHKLNLPKKITGGKTIGVKPVIDASERQYNTLLNLQRMNAMDDFIKKYPKATDDELIQYARSINNATGRGNVDYKALNGIFYSPRFLASRWGTGGDIIKSFAQAVTGNGNAASKEILTDATRFVGSRALILLAGAQTGAWKIETDPKSSDWMKIKVGGRVFDPWAGYLGPARFMVQAYQKDKKAVNNLVGSYLGNKSAPNINLYYELKDRKDFDGKKTTPLASFGRAVTPLNIQGLLQAWKETNGDLGESLAAFTADSTGIGTGKARGKGGGSGPSIPRMKSGFTTPKFSIPKMRF